MEDYTDKHQFCTAAYGPLPYMTVNLTTFTPYPQPNPIPRHAFSRLWGYMSDDAIIRLQRTALYDRRSAKGTLTTNLPLHLTSQSVSHGGYIRTMSGIAPQCTARYARWASTTRDSMYLESCLMSLF